MFNLPVSDKLGFRIAFIEAQHDGYDQFQAPPVIAGVNPSGFVTQGNKYYSEDRWSARISGLWKPTEDFSWNLSYEYYKDNGGPVLPLMQQPRPGEQLWSTLVEVAPEQDRTSQAIRSRMDYALSDYLDLSYIAGASFLSGTTDYQADAGSAPPTSASTPVGAFEDNRTPFSRFNSYSNVLQLKCHGTHNVDRIIGADQSIETNAIRFDVDLANGYSQGPFNWAGAFVQPDRTLDDEAIFGQATWHVNDDLRLTGGLRESWDSERDVGGRNARLLQWLPRASPDPAMSGPAARRPSD